MNGNKQHTVEHVRYKLPVLMEAGTALLKAESKEACLSIAIERLRWLVDYDLVLLGFVDGQHTTMDLSIVSPDGTVQQSLALPLGKVDKILKETFENTTVKMENSTDAIELIRSGHKSISAINSTLCVPLETGEKTVGVFGICSQKVEAYRKSDVDILELLASQLALNMSNQHNLVALRRDQERMKLAQEELKRSTIAALNMMEDANEAKMALEEQQKELERSNAELEQFAYVASHDLKAPVTNMGGLLSIIESENGVNDQNKHVFEKVKLSVVRMQNTISSLNEVIGLKKNLRLECKDNEFTTVLSDVLSGLETQISESNAKIKSDFSECASVSYPAVHLSHILQNLISNSIKHCKKGKAPIVNISTTKDKDSICLTVKDNGLGIDMKLYGDKLFGLFQRFNLASEGQGIGLHVTKSIVESYGGRIEVASKTGQGTTFRIYFI